MLGKTNRFILCAHNALLLIQCFAIPKSLTPHCMHRERAYSSVWEKQSTEQISLSHARKGEGVTAAITVFCKSIPVLSADGFTDTGFTRSSRLQAEKMLVAGENSVQIGT